MNQYKVLSSHSGMYTIYDERNKQSLSDTDVCNLLNDLKTELMIKEDLIQQMRNAVYTDDREEMLKFRRLYVSVCEDLADMNNEYAKFENKVKEILQKKYEANNRKLVFKAIAEELGLEFDL